jgi:hypothetical protein
MRNHYEYELAPAPDEYALSPRQRPQTRRHRRQRLLELALPCVLLAGIAVAALIVMGHNAGSSGTPNATRAPTVRAASRLLSFEDAFRERTIKDGGKTRH